MLNSYGTDDIISIAAFYDQRKVIKDNLEPPIVNKEALEEQHKAYKLLILKDSEQNLKTKRKANRLWHMFSTSKVTSES